MQNHKPNHSPDTAPDTTRNLIGGALMLVCVAPVANVAPWAALLLCGIALGLLAGGVDRG